VCSVFVCWCLQTHWRCKPVIIKALFRYLCPAIWTESQWFYCTTFCIITIEASILFLWFSKRKIFPSTFEYLIFLLLSNKFLSIVPCESLISCLGGVLCDGYEIGVMCDVTALINVLIFSTTTQYDYAFVLSGCRNIPNLLSVSYIVSNTLWFSVLSCHCRRVLPVFFFSWMVSMFVFCIN